VDHQKVLGTTIDDSLLWRVQIDKNEKHYRTKIKMLKRMFILGSTVMSKFYFATIIPSVTYNIAVWGNNNVILKKLEILHVRAAKKIFQLPDHLSDDDVLKAAGWMSIEYLYKRRLLCLMHKIFYRNIDSELSNMFYILNSNSTPQRRDNQVKIANQFRSTNQNTFVVRASKIWNAMPNELTGISKFDIFRSKLKDFKTKINKFSFTYNSYNIRDEYVFI